MRSAKRDSFSPCLRAFAFAGSGGDVALLSRALKRVALDGDARVVHSSPQGGGKDTWVIG